MTAGERPDLQAAVDQLKMTYGIGREVKRLPQYLWENETVDCLCTGTYGRGQGLLTLTNRRLFFLHLGIRGITEEGFPFDKISSVNWSSGIRTGAITISTTGNKKSRIENVNPADGKVLTDRVRAVLAGDQRPTGTAEAPAPASTTPPPPGIPAGWYPDADNDKLLRYWDGQVWTEHTAPNAQ